MTYKEALKLALEALEEIHPGNMTPMAESNWNKAITAIREALAEQPAQQHEPAAWIYEDELPEGYPYDDMYGLSRIIEGVRMFPVNVAPPASKPLTDELDVLRAVSAEYNAWIRYHAGGGNYDDFLQRELAAIKGKV